MGNKKYPEACPIRPDRWFSRQLFSPAAEEWVEIRDYNNAAGTRGRRRCRMYRGYSYQSLSKKNNVVAAL
jgi:hypothetical protein